MLDIGVFLHKVGLFTFAGQLKRFWQGDLKSFPIFLMQMVILLPMGLSTFGLQDMAVGHDQPCDDGVIELGRVQKRFLNLVDLIHFLLDAVNFCIYILPIAKLD